MSDYKEIIVKEYHNEKGLLTRREVGEELVRCKDCKYWDSDCIWCDLWGNTQEYDDGYCNYGERKEK